MSKELPNIIFVGTAEAEEGIVIQVYAVLIYHDMTLHNHLLEAIEESLSEILQIMIANYQVDFAIQSVKYLCPFGSTSQTEVAEVEYVVIRADDLIPIGYKRFIHVIDILKRTIAELKYVSMIEVGV